MHIEEVKENEKIKWDEPLFYSLLKNVVEENMNHDVLKLKMMQASAYTDGITFPKRQTILTKSILI